MNRPLLSNDLRSSESECGSSSTLENCVRYKRLICRDVYLLTERATARALLSTFVLSCESHEIFIKTKSVITTRIMPRGVDPQQFSRNCYPVIPLDGMPRCSLLVPRDKELSTTAKAARSSGSITHRVTDGQGHVTLRW